MTKITLDRETFKALASDTRLDILKTLDGKNLGLNEIVKATNLNKATLHEHLAKLHDAGLIKRNERDGHKWVYYKLTWKGESLLHPENTRIVVMFATTFIALWVGIIQFVSYIKGTVINAGSVVSTVGEKTLLASNGLLESNDFLSYKAEGASVSSYTSGLPDLFQTFLLKVRMTNNEIEYAPSSRLLGTGDGARLIGDSSQGVIQTVSQNPMYLYIAEGCFILFTVIFCIALWRYWANRTQKI